MTEVYINNTLVDIKEDLPIPLNYAIADLKSPDKRNTSFSKTIVLPGSKVNNELFSHIYDISKEALVSGTGKINFTPDFNPNLKAKCQIYTDSLLQFNGFVQLLKINKDEEKIEYEVAVFGSLANLFTELEGLKLENLDLSEYNHIFNKANQKNSWDTSIIKDGSAYVNFSGGNPIGEGYVYPLIDYGYDQSQSIYKVKNLFPAIYVKTYIDKIFERANFTYSSNFFNSTFFKRLVIPTSSEAIKLSQAQIEERKFLATTPSPSSYNIILNNNGGSATAGSLILDPVIFTNDSTGAGFDPSGVYSTTTGKYKVNKTGLYDLTTTFNVTRTINLPTGADENKTFYRNNNFLVRIYKTSGVYLAEKYFIFDKETESTISGEVKATGITLTQNEEVIIRVYHSPNYTFKNSSGTELHADASEDLVLNSFSFYNDAISIPVDEGELLLLSSAIPREVLIKDFFLSIIKMFNCYVKPDSENERNLLIEPQIDFYSGNEVIDWTDKLDTKKKIEIRPVSEIEGKEYVFSYKEDKDYYNDKYFIKYSNVYGTKSQTINNDFVKGKSEIKLVFSPSPLVGNFFNSIVIPRYVKRNDDGSVSPQAGNIKILYYGGLKSGSWTYSSQTSGDTSESSYPYAGHVDDPNSPTIDLLFHWPEELYYAPNSYTDNNLFSKYWQQFIEEITDKDSKIVTAYFRLRPEDIFKLDFKNFIHVDGINYRLNKIIDYNPLDEESTKVELAKIKRGVPFVPGEIDIGNGGNTEAKVLDGGLNNVLRYKNVIDGGENDNDSLLPILNGV
jgi:hypothetical protein